MSFLDRLVTASLPILPRFVARWVSRPYIAGEELADAVARVRELNALGAAATMDLLGEEMTKVEQCREVAGGYLEMLEAIRREGIDSGVSVKLSSLGLALDPELAHELLTGILETARETSRFVRIDMEDATTTDATLDLYGRLREEGFENVGVVLQARLHRTYADAERLADLGADVRVVKGIYIEPESIAWRDPDVIRENFVRVLRLLLRRGCRVASATHDDFLVAETRTAVEELGVDSDRFEFQMLLGVREDLRDRILKDDARLRVYVPFGKEWYAYSVRRLKENPAIAGHVTRAFFGKAFHQRRGRGQRP